FCGVAACSSVLVAFFGYASPRDPASFPTRRSSDLGDEVSVDLGITVDGDVAREAEEVPRDHHVAEAHRLGRPEHAAAQASLNLDVAGAGHELAVDGAADRNSLPERDDVAGDSPVDLDLPAHRDQRVVDRFSGGDR